MAVERIEVSRGAKSRRGRLRARVSDRTPGAASGRTNHLDRVLRIALRRLGDFLLPPLCLACRTRLADHDTLCADCWGDICFIRPPVCDRLGIPLPYELGPEAVSTAALLRPPVYDRARAVATYDGAMRALIHRLKYADSHEGVRLFGRWLAHAGSELIEGAALILPVPLSRGRLFRRRFNQAALLAGALARETGIPHEPLILERIRATRSQVGLSAEERRLNVAGAFRVHERGKRLIAGRRVLLVDDVITTGATVEACAQALKGAGASGVDVLALARVVDMARILA